MSNIDLAEEMVLKKKYKLKINKSAGPDGIIIQGCVLKETKQTICVPHATTIFSILSQEARMVSTSSCLK